MKKIKTQLKNMLQVILLLLLAGCSKTTEIVPEFEYATYAAAVECYDEFGLRVDDSGVRVSVDGIEYLSTQTDDIGYFELKVPVGTYTFNYTKDGFADHSHKKVTLIGGYQPVLYFNACLFKPVDVLIADYELIFNPEENSILVKAFASCETPFALFLGFKTDLESDLEKIFSVIDCESGYRDGVGFSKDIGYARENLDDVDIAYLALYSKNYYGGDYPSLIQLSEFQKIVLVK
jgi:hypothetical protein